jgi:membrane-associated phospholipid phosphatase
MQTANDKRICDPGMSIPGIFSEKPSLGLLGRLTGKETLYWLLMPWGLIVAGLLAMSVDCQLARWCLGGNCPGALENLFSTLEPFGNGLGVAIIGLTIFCLDPARRWALPRVLGCAYLAGLAANGLKLLLARTRPHSFDFHGGVFDTFGHWLPMTSAGSTGQSFPSGHTATAVALAAALAWLYPRGRRLFPLMAVMVACHRIESGAHFLSDVLWGAAVGTLIAICFLKIGLLPIWLDRMEERMNAERGLLHKTM